MVVQRPTDATDRRGRRRLVGRARRAARSAHPSVVTPLRIDDHGAVIIWPWLAGGDLASQVARHGPLDDRWASDVVDTIGGAIRAIHQAGFVHGAVDAGHVVLDEDGRPFLIGIDPRARSNPATVAADLAALAEVRSIAGGTGTASAARLSANTTPPGPDRCGRRPMAGRPSSADHLRRGLVAGVVVALLGALVAVRSDTRPGCREPAPPPALTADVDDDGCPDQLAWSTEHATLRASLEGGDRAWMLGVPGDRLLLGDWDCDGSITPGLYRPDTRSTFTFDRWPLDGPVRARRADGAPRCDR